MIDSYGISMTSLEDIFVKLAKEEEMDSKDEEIKKIDAKETDRDKAGKKKVEKTSGVAAHFM